MTLRRYRHTKPSGALWLGDIPSNWQVKRLKYLCAVLPSNVDKKTYEGELPVKLCNYTDVYYNEEITASLEFTSATATPEQVSRFSLRSGDSIITKDSETSDDIAVASYVPKDLPGVVCGYHLAIVRPKGQVHGRYMKRLFDSKYLKSKFDVAANGLTRVGLSQYALDNVEIPLPPFDEQDQIVAFLERETQRIDALVGQQERLIELLKEKRQAAISHAVTKGLNPNAPMKPSGIGRLGAVPADWSVVGLKRLVRFQRGHDLPTDSRSVGHVPVVSSGGRLGTHNAACARGPGIVTGRYGSIGDFFFIEEDYWPLNTALYSIDLHGNVPRYVWYVLHSIAELFVVESMKSAVPGVDRNDIHVIRVARATLADQHRIVGYLDAQTKQIDELVAGCRRAISLLEERRAALISAAVTGQVDIRQLEHAETA